VIKGKIDQSLVFCELAHGQKAATKAETENCSSREMPMENHHTRSALFFLFRWCRHCPLFAKKHPSSSDKGTQFLVKSPHETTFLSVYKGKDNISDFKRTRIINLQSGFLF